MGSRSNKVRYIDPDTSLTYPNQLLRTDTLIVWQEPGTQIDMALSFQEAEGCAAIW